jgi:hypothetical protein
MTNEELAAALALGHEQTGVECKAAGPRWDSNLFAQVTRAALAMANRRDGGFIVIGIRDDDSSLAADPMSVDDLATWNHDEIADGFKAAADPGIAFTRMEREYQGHSVVVLQVRPFDTVPVVCTQTYQKTGVRGPGSFVLREGALYVRGRTKAESVEATPSDMRDILEFATQQRLRAFLATAQGAGVSLTQLAAASTRDAFDSEAQPRAHPLAARILDGTHWDVRIRPTLYEQTRIAFTSLPDVVARATVESRRGWTVPAINGGESLLGMHHIDRLVDRHGWLTWWRFCQSGQFIQCEQISGDTLYPMSAAAPDSPPRFLEVSEVLGTFTEAFELAARFAELEPGNDSFQVSVTARNITGFRLAATTGVGARGVNGYSTALSEIPFERTLARADLLSGARDHALEGARELLARFTYPTNASLLRSLQDALAR